MITTPYTRARKRASNRGLHTIDQLTFKTRQEACYGCQRYADDTCKYRQCQYKWELVLRNAHCPDEHWGGEVVEVTGTITTGLME